MNGGPSFPLPLSVLKGLHSSVSLSNPCVILISFGNLLLNKSITRREKTHTKFSHDLNVNSKLIRYGRKRMPHEKPDDVFIFPLQASLSYLSI